MALGIHFLVNFVMLAIPIGVTLGILFGIDAQRASSGLDPLYSQPANSGSGSGGGNYGGGGTGSALTTKTYCQKSLGITPITKGQQFTLNPNQWGWNETDGGGLCMNVTTFDNSTYPTTTTAPNWTITWSYPQGPESQPVHAFPNVLVDGGVFPSKVESLSQIGLDVAWSYGLGDTVAQTTDKTTLATDSLNANVAVDMFLDSDKTKSGESDKATYEVMVWLADFGDAAQPIGLAKGAVATETLNGTTFNLYVGTNSNSQNVLTWVATSTAVTFNGDLLPLFTKLFSLSGTTYPSASDYLGYMAFGSEAYYATTNVTFAVSHLSMDVETTS